MSKNVSLKTKLLVLCAFLSLMSVFIGFVSYTGSNKVAQSYELVSDSSLPSLNSLNEMFLSYQSIRINLRSLGLTNIPQDVASDALKGLAIAQASFLKAKASYEQHIQLPRQKELYAVLEQEWVEFSQIGEKAVKAYQSKETSTLEAIFFVECPKSAADFEKAISNLKAHEMELSQSFVESAKSAASMTNIVIFSLAITGLIFGMIVGIFFSNTIAKTLGGIASNIMESSEKTSNASSELNSASSQLSQGASESAASIEETVSSLEELSSMVKLNTDHAKEANSLSQKSFESAQEGELEMQKLISAMNNMSQSSKKIEEIINVIDDISFQTNLLALNAAVEAARAGEQGKGFAVVADAVRGLAQRSAVAAKNINELIVENVSMNNEGVAMARQSGLALQEIVSSVKRVASLNSEISAASQEQANGIEQITKAMSHLDTAIQQNASSSEEVAASSENMSEQSEQLVTLVNQLKDFVDGKSETAAQVYEFQKHKARLAA